jgi:predicted transposase YbfD/YdcC
MLDIRDITITADALHCQCETCVLIVQAGGDYCLQLKGNQGDMLADMRAFVHVVSKRTTGEKTSHSERFYLFSKKHTA